MRVVAILVVIVWFCGNALPAFAQDPEPPPPAPDPITQIFQYVIQFPTDSLVQALTQAIQAILTKSIEPLERVFSASLARWVTASPGILTPGGGIVDGADVMTPVWNLTSRIAILLWPLTLAVTAAIAAKDVVAARTWGIGDLKQALGTWGIAVVLSASSLYWMDLANRFANATTAAILNLSFTGAAGFDPNLLTSILIGSAVIVLGMTGLGIIVAIIILIVGISILAALILQFLARFALLYVLVAIAPIVITMGVMPPLRWFSYTWLRGFVMVLLIGPVNALLLKLVMVLGVRGISNDPITAFVNCMAAAGVLSALLTINYTLIRFVFGAIGQVMERAVGTITAVGTLALAAVGGAAAAGAVGAAGSAAGSAGSGSPLAGGGGLAGAFGNTRGLGAGLETAGSVLARSGGMGRGLGAALWGVGNALRQPNGDGRIAGRANNQRQPMNRPTSSSGAVNPAASLQPRPNNDPSSLPDDHGTPVVQHTNTRASGAAENAQPVADSSSSVDQRSANHASASPRTSLRTGRATQPSLSQRPDGTSAAIGSTPLRADGPRLEAGSGAPGATGTTPIGARLAPPPTSDQVAPEAQSLIDLLDTPLSDRVRDIVSSYAGNPTEQITTAQGAVAALSALESHHNVEPLELASIWDRTMHPVVTSSREGLPLETIANDAGYRGDVTQFIGARLEGGLLATKPTVKPPIFARSESPAVVAWHPQLSPHDIEVGQQLATLLAVPPRDAPRLAQIYHQLRSPETGGGWNAGLQLRRAAQDVTNLEPATRLGALDSRLRSMDQSRTSPDSLRAWRIYLARKQAHKD